MLVMRRLGAMIVICTLAACGGESSSGSGGGVVLPTPTPTPTPAPTPTPSPAATISYLHTFAIEPGDGAQPNGPLLQASDGNFYGTTRAGGSGECRPELPVPCGVIFRITPSGDETVFYSFRPSGEDGYTPLGGLIQGADGALYGTTSNGGAFGGSGTIFRIDLNGQFRVLHSFSGINGEGHTSTDALTLADDGNFYGVTKSGGANICGQIPQAGGNCGTIFKMTATGEFTTLHSFGRTASDGVQPNGPLLQTADGSFYGTTGIGGSYNRGTIFRLTPAGALNIIYSFGETSGDPSSPQGSLIEDSNGILYGTTPSGGTGSGTVYRLDRSDRVTVLFNFEQNVSGSGPSRVLALGKDGNIYGTTRTGGQNGRGTAFRLSTSGALTTLFTFGPIQEKPYDPETGVIEGADGALYGTTFYNEGLGAVGARSGSGTVYKLTIR